MMNELTQIGQQLIVKLDNPLTGISSIDSFTDDIDGLTGVRTVVKEFSYSTDGLNWSDWQNLTNSALQQIVVNRTQDFDIQYRYTRTGVDQSGVIAFNSINLATTYQGSKNTTSFNSSVISKLIKSDEDSQIVSWAMNVYKKLYNKGILPEAIVRTGNENEQDRDLIDLLRGITSFIAMHVAYGRKFGNFDSDKDLSILYLQSKQIYVDDRQSLSELTYIMYNLYSEMSRRGTLDVFSKYPVTINQQSQLINGEVLRLIKYNDQDESLISISGPKTIGWNINNNSPLNKYVHDSDRLNKLGRTVNGVLDIPLTDTTYTSIDEDVVTIQGLPVNQRSGVGSLTYNADFNTIVDNNTAYELRFMIKGTGTFSVGVKGFDDKNNPIQLPLMSPILSSEYAMKSQRLASSDWQSVRLIIYGWTTGISDDSSTQKPNIGVGYNLKWTKDVVSSSFQLTLDKTASTNTPPTVNNKQIIINNGQLRTITLQDVVSGYADQEDNPFKSITINSITSQGDLILNGSVVGSFPITVTNQQLIDGQLAYEDDSSITGAKTIQMDYVVNDQTPTFNSQDILYIRDIEFKPLNTSYSKGIIGAPILIESWIKNNSSLANDYINDIIAKEMVPHNVGVINNFLQKTSKLGNIPNVEGIYEERYEEIYQ